MKTTIELDDALLKEAKRLAANENRSLRDVTEAALRRYLEEARQRRAKPFRLRKVSYKGKGLQPGLREGHWSAIRDLTYEGRGS
jgi:Arc/MetJ family transcription regulator